MFTFSLNSQIFEPILMLRPLFNIESQGENFTISFIFLNTQILIHGTGIMYNGLQYREHLRSRYTTINTILMFVDDILPHIQDCPYNGSLEWRHWIIYLSSILLLCNIGCLHLFRAPSLIDPAWTPLLFVATTTTKPFFIGLFRNWLQE